MKTSTSLTKYWILMALFFLGIIISAIKPYDYFTWILEVFPAILGMIVLLVTFRKFRFTDFVYLMILIHCYILFIGGHYTYAEVPVFNWLKEIFHLQRNNYDKVGHFAQGFVPALITRELFIRKNIVTNKEWLSFLTITVCITVSVLYEFIEWFVSIATGQSADAFLGTQGYAWDTQSDMLVATIGAICAVVFFSKFHNKQIEQLKTIRSV